MSRFTVIILIAFAVVSANSQNIDKYEQLGEKSFQRGDYTAAIENYSHVIDLSSRLDQHSNSHRTDFTNEATSEISNITAVDPRTAAGLVNRGRAYFASGSPEKAVNDYNRAIAIVPAMTSAFLCRGIAYVGLKKYDLALNDFERAIKLDKSELRGYVGRGIAKLGLGSNAAAMADFDYAVELKSKDPLVFYYRGEARRLTADFTGALIDFEHEHQVLVNRNVALSARADHSRQQLRICRIRDVIDTNPVEVSLKKVVALESNVRVGESKLSKDQLLSTWHL